MEDLICLWYSSKCLVITVERKTVCPFSNCSCNSNGVVRYGLRYLSTDCTVGHSPEDLKQGFKNKQTNKNSKFTTPSELHWMTLLIFLGGHRHRSTQHPALMAQVPGSVAAVLAATSRSLGNPATSNACGIAREDIFAILDCLDRLPRR
jgi:hypothetical protein